MDLLEDLVDGAEERRQSDNGEGRENKKKWGWSLHGSLVD